MPVLGGSTSHICARGSWPRPCGELETLACGTAEPWSSEQGTGQSTGWTDKPQELGLGARDGAAWHNTGHSKKIYKKKKKGKVGTG